jgi:hypothetical protein
MTGRRMSCAALTPASAWTASQVLGKAFEIVRHVAETADGQLTKRDAFVALGGLVEKMSDVKLKGPAGDAMSALSEAVGTQFVCAQLHKKAAAHKNPKVRAMCRTSSTLPNRDPLSHCSCQIGSAISYSFHCAPCAVLAAADAAGLSTGAAAPFGACR